MFIKFVVKLTACLALVGAFSLLSFSQQTSSQPASSTSSDTSTQEQSQDAKPAAGQQPATQPSSSQQESDKKKDSTQNPNEQGKVEGTSKDRLFYTLPNFLTLESRKQLPPLTTKDKFKVVALGTFDPVEYPWWGVLAAISQADNGNPAFGQGWLSYAKRYGITAGDSTVENFMVGAVFPSVLHQDPRYYQSGQGGFFRRTGYTISRIFVTRTDSGHAQFNFSEVVGAYTAACISTYTYHPRSTILSTPSNPRLFVKSEQTFDNTVSTWGTQISLDTVTLIVKEFWPDIHRKISHKHNSDPKAAAPKP